MKHLVLTPSFVSAIGVVGDVFRHPWTKMTVEELSALAGGRKPLSGPALSNKLNVLLKQGSRIREGLYECFTITPYQVKYATPDRRYQVSLQQGQTEETLCIWRLYSRKAGASSFSFSVTRDLAWRLGDIRVSPACAFDLKLLAEAGGEVLGYFALRSLLPEQSPLYRAVVERIDASDARAMEIRQTIIR